MVAKRTYKPQPKTEVQTIPGAMPVDRSVAVYYRQWSSPKVSVKTGRRDTV